LSNSNSASLVFTGKQQSTFTCLLDGAPLLPCSSPVALIGLGEGEHSFSVRQIDVTGRTSPAVTFNWTVDTTAPMAPVFEQTPPAATSSRSLTARFGGEQGGSFECRAAAENWQECTSPRNFISLPDDDYWLEVRQRDEAGNTGPVSRIKWTVDTIRPAPPTLSGLPPGTVRSTIAIASIGGEPGGRYECRLNGNAWTACQARFEMAGLSHGSQRLETRQIDEAGNTGEVATAEWAVDTIAPRLSGKVIAKRTGSRVRLTTTFVSSLGRPERLEYTTARARPTAASPPNPSRTSRWAPTVSVNSRAKVTWIRISDLAGNQSPWTRVR
jgi:hypothetical protein